MMDETGYGQKYKSNVHFHFFSRFTNARQLLQITYSNSINSNHDGWCQAQECCSSVYNSETYKNNIREKLLKIIKLKNLNYRWLNKK